MENVYYYLEKYKVLVLLAIVASIISFRLFIGGEIEKSGERDLIKKVETNFFLKTVSIETQTGKKVVLALNKTENLLPTFFAKDEEIYIGTFGVSAHNLFYVYSFWNFF